MHKLLTLIIVLLFFSSCKENIPIKENLIIDMEKVESVFVDEITDDLKYVSLNLPNDVYIGSIAHIKSYNNYIFIHDQYQTKTITIVDTQGGFVGQLNKKGRGPGEYGGIDAFSFDIINNELITYDRATMSFIFYSFPNLKYLKTLRKDKYIMNFEALDSNNWLVVCENEDGKNNYHGIEIWDDKFQIESAPSNIGKVAASIEISYPNTITRINKKIYYAHPHEYTTIYRISSKEQVPEIRIDFGKNKIPAKYWNNSDAHKFEEVLEKGEPKAVWVQNFIFNNETISFWSTYENIETKYLTIYDRKLKKEKVFSELKIKDSQIKLAQPIGLIYDNYVSVIYPEEINSSSPLQNKNLSNAILNNNGKLTPILVLFKLKNPFNINDNE